MCKRINIFFPVYLCTYILFSIIYASIMHEAGISQPFWQQCLISQTILLIPPIIYIIIFRINVIKCLPIRKLKISDALLSLLLGYLLIPAVLLVNYISMLFSTNYMQETQQELTNYPFALQILLIAVIPPLVEEFIFRGLFYHSYRKNGIVGAALVSALIFGVWHLNINQCCYAVLVGIVFALLVEATGSIWSSVIAHFAINTFSIIINKIYSYVYGEYYTELQTKAQTMIKSPLENIITISFLLPLAVLFLTAAFFLYRAIAKRNGRWEYMKNNIKLGLKPQNKEHFFNVASVAAFLAAIAFMIYTEVM